MDLGKLAQMGQGQEQFLSYITERVHDEHNDSAKELLGQDFKKMKEGNLSHDDIKKTQETLMKMVKPEDVEQVKAAMETFAAQMKK